ncbi:MAG: hypothetical protein KKF66_04880, partial [Actinobacteria bacterium]|nr:hypothetical protein [Actinomycetota bacterium]
SPLEATEDGWELPAVKKNFHTMAYTYGRLDELGGGAASRLAAGAIDRLVLSRTLPSPIRRFFFDRLNRWADGRFQPEWIKY